MSNLSVYILSCNWTVSQSDNTKLRQRFSPGGAIKAKGPNPVVKADQMASPKRHLSLVAIMLILVAIVLGYLVGKWL